MAVTVTGKQVVYSQRFGSYVGNESYASSISICRLDSDGVKNILIQIGQQQQTYRDDCDDEQISSVGEKVVRLLLGSTALGRQGEVEKLIEVATQGFADSLPGPRFGQFARMIDRIFCQVIQQQPPESIRSVVFCQEEGVISQDVRIQGTKENMIHGNSKMVLDAVLRYLAPETNRGQAAEALMKICNEMGLDAFLVDAAEIERGGKLYESATADLEAGKFSEAMKSIEEALAIYEKQRSRLKIVDAHVLKGRLLGFLKHYREAVAELLGVFEENLAIRGEGHKEVTRLYKHLGWHLGELAKRGGNLECLDSSKLELVKAHLGVDAQADSLAFAQRCFEKALAEDTLNFGENHPETAKSYSLVGRILGDQKKYSEALEYHRKALAIRSACFAQPHADVARSYSNLGWTFEQLKNYRGAMKNYEHALAIKEQVLGSNHPETVQDRENIQRLTSVLFAE